MKLPKIQTVFMSAAFVLSATLLGPAALNAAQDIIGVSATRTSTFTSSDLVKGSVYRGLYANVVVTSAPVPSTGNALYLEVQGKDAGGNYYSMLSSAAVTASTAVKLYPGFSAVTGAVANDALPDSYRVLVTHSGTASWIYSVNGNTLQ